MPSAIAAERSSSWSSGSPTDPGAEMGAEAGAEPGPHGCVILALLAAAPCSQAILAAARVASELQWLGAAVWRSGWAWAWACQEYACLLDLNPSQSSLGSARGSTPHLQFEAVPQGTTSLSSGMAGGGIAIRALGGRELRSTGPGGPRLPIIPGRCGCSAAIGCGCWLPPPPAIITGGGATPAILII